MTIRLLGTGAAEGVPAMWGASRVSLHARKVGGKEVRSRCGALIDGRLKIDLPPDTNYHLLRDGLDATDWSALFFTHTHDDHFAIKELQYGLYPFSGDDVLGYSIFGNAEACRRIRETYPEWPIDLEETHKFVPIRFGEYEVTPIHANHMESEEAHNLIFSDGEKTFLYGTDTGIWEPPTWEFLQSVRLDGMAIECTQGRFESDYYGHLSLEGVVQVVDRLRTMGTLKPNASVCTTHHSHNGDMTFEELEPALAEHGIVAGYDGLEFTI